MARVYSFSFPDDYDLPAVIGRISNGRKMSRSAAVIHALNTCADGRGRGLDRHIPERMPLGDLLESRSHDDLLDLVRRLVRDAPGRAADVRQSAQTVVRLIDYCGREGPAPGVS